MIRPVYYSTQFASIFFVIYLQGEEQKFFSKNFSNQILNPRLHKLVFLEKM